MLLTIFALDDFNYEKIKMLKVAMEKDVWYVRNVPEYNKEKIRDKIIWAKFVLCLCILNPIIVIPSILTLHLQPEWIFFSSANKTVRVLLQVLYILHVVSSYGVVYSHLLIHVYFNLYFKILMHSLSLYIALIPADSDDLTKLQNVHNSLMEGVRKHRKLMR